MENAVLRNRRVEPNERGTSKVESGYLLDYYKMISAPFNDFSRFLVP